MDTLETRSRDMQERTFCKWCVSSPGRNLEHFSPILHSSRLNTKLEVNGYPPMSSLVKDLSDGVRLIQLMVSRVDQLALDSA